MQSYASFPSTENIFLFFSLTRCDTPAPLRQNGKTRAKSVANESLARLQAIRLWAFHTII
jgi:hypothetical protein